jgi:hypothetical protein
MESLNLTTLNGVLPLDQLKVEQEISEKFKSESPFFLTHSLCLCGQGSQTMV